MTYLPSGYDLIGVTVPNFPGTNQVREICTTFNGRLIDFYTMDMEQLTVIAKYRILPVPTLLLLTGHKTVLRIVKEIPNIIQFQQFIELTTGNQYEKGQI